MSISSGLLLDPVSGRFSSGTAVRNDAQATRGSYVATARRWTSFGPASTSASTAA